MQAPAQHHTAPPTHVGPRNLRQSVAASIMHFYPQQLRGWVMTLVGAFSGHLHTGLECHGMVTTGNWQLLDVGWVSQTRRCFLRALAHRGGVHAPHHSVCRISIEPLWGCTLSPGPAFPPCTVLLMYCHASRVAQPAPLPLAPGVQDGGCLGCTAVAVALGVPPTKWATRAC